MGLSFIFYMLKINISKGDVIWSYVSQFFNIASGFITLPLILHMLTTEEIAMNYLMLTVTTLVTLMDFGFTPQISRQVSYVYSGANELLKEGFVEGSSNEVNYRLLACLLQVTRKIFRIISAFVLLLLLTFGTLYIYSVTRGFTNVDNSLAIWMVFCVSSFFSVYFKYYDSLLIGRGLIKESKQCILANKIFQILMVYILLLSGVGLIGVCIANLISPFLGRFFAYRYFYDKETIVNLKGQTFSKEETNNVFFAIWYNAKKIGINFLGTYCTRQFGMFLIGLYLFSDVVASYGLMMQFVTIVTSISVTFYNALQPQIISYKIQGDKKLTIRKFSLSIVVFYALCICGLSMVALFGPWALSLIGSNAQLPALSILLLYSIVCFLEENHSNFAIFISSGNIVPFVPAALTSGLLICLGDFVVLQFTSLGLFGIIMVQGIVQLAYNNWYWPRWVLKEYHISFLNFLKIGICELVEQVNIFLKKENKAELKIVINDNSLTDRKL